MGGAGRRRPVHPRSRGEHAHELDVDLTTYGSSPLARGTRAALPQPWAVFRFIPARAGNTGARWAPSRSTTVHPRSRGEHSSAPGLERHRFGSSPLARGTHRRGQGDVLARRFIPARAGNTGWDFSSPTGGTVHPRSRGEHAAGPLRPARGAGSSPLARGTRPMPDTLPLLARFIPARAGNTISRQPRRAWTAVHPRSRGEHACICGRPKAENGSSPLARGTPRRQRQPQLHHRFIPARAGNTCTVEWRSPPSSVHPRSRGEHRRTRRARHATDGSSPLARGTLRASVECLAIGRFIPARAGNTSRSRRARWSPTVHPRSRGEHAARRPGEGDLGGSSPLARGTRRAARHRSPRRRFIPARAGNTSQSSYLPSDVTVHPRSRGEHRNKRVLGGQIGGSSPLARGTPGSRAGCQSLRRFIPARAGNTGAGCQKNAHRPVHPRSRGEHLRPEVARRGAAGSSPLARGTRLVPVWRSKSNRFIPARAGNTGWHRFHGHARPVHPRSRGEHMRTAGRDHLVDGSSPLARGTPRCGTLPGLLRRFIPARAGNTRR